MPLPHSMKGLWGTDEGNCDKGWGKALFYDGLVAQGCTNVSLSTSGSKSSFNRNKPLIPMLNDSTETLEVGPGRWDSSVLSKKLNSVSGCVH